MTTQRPRVRLVHWNEREAVERVARLRAAGFDATGEFPEPPAFLRRLREERPAAVVIGLARVPSHGRDLALAIRSQKATRDIPLLVLRGSRADPPAERARLAPASGGLGRHAR
jgi:hypothetical protein